MRKRLLKLLMLSLMLIPSLTFAQLGQNGSIMPAQQKKILADQHVTHNKLVTSIFTEDFSGGAVPATGWTIVGGGEANWNWYSSSNNAGGSAPEAAFGWGPPYFSGNTKMITPVIATSGNTSLVLEFHHFVWDYAGSGYSYKIETTSDGGTTWNEVWSISPTGDIAAEMVTLVINNEDVGSDNFQFALTFDGNSTQINYWYFDDFVLSASTAESYDVTYIVKDEDDNLIEGAEVTMQSGGTLTTDALGEAVFENILAGDYTWQAVASGLSTEEGSVTITDADKSVDVVMGISYELLSEHFAGGTFPPEGWSIFGDGQSNWNRVNSNNAGIEYPELRFNSSPVFTGNSKFVSPEVVTSDYTDLFLEFNYLLLDNSGSDYSIKVETTSDGGTTWNEVWSVSPTGDLGPEYQKVLISTDDVGSDVFQFALTFDGNSAQIANWYIDDVVLSAAMQYDAALISTDIAALAVPGVDIEPGVEVANMGSEIISFDVTFEFTDGANVYSETLTVTDLAPLATETIVFPTWTSIAGSFDGQAYLTFVDDENHENDSINFGIEVASGLFPKKPLYEMFTSSTCPPCVYGNEVLDAILAANPDEYTIIKHQVNWPGTGDPYYIEEAGERVGYYGISSVPDLYINSEQLSPSLITQAIFDEYQDAETAFQINITEATIDDDNMISIAANLMSAVNYSAGLSAHIVIIEKLTVDNVGSNGETEFHNVMMKMLPDASGEILDEIKTGVPTTLTEVYDMDLTFMETSDDLAVVVFVQDDTDKNILQSAMVDINSSTGSSSDAEIVAFSFDEQINDATIDSDAQTVNVNVTEGTNVTSLIASFEISESAMITVGDVIQASGSTANDFTNPVDYAVKAEDGTTKVWTVTVNFVVNIDESLQDVVRLYPNPASKNLMIQSVLAIQKIELYNQVGQLVKFKNTNGNALNVNITDIESGVYFVKVFSQERVITKSLVVE